MIELAKEIIAGKRMTRQDNLDDLLSADLDDLCTGANLIRQSLCGEKVDLCTIINGRSGKCSEDCKFCAQSANHESGVSTYAFLDPDLIVADCKKNEAAGVHRYSIVTAGRSLNGLDLDKAIQAYTTMHDQCSIGLCASHGFLTEEELIRLKKSGVTMYHENIETSRNHFPTICTTHTYDDKIKEIKLAQKTGFQVCSGGIIGMGETWEDRIDMAISLWELGIESIPINVLMPITGTPFGNLERISDDDIVRTIAIFRYINPTANIRMAAGRIYFADGGAKLFRSGANATITGDLLTTVGTNTQQDIDMFINLGFDITK